MVDVVICAPGPPGVDVGVGVDWPDTGQTVVYNGIRTVVTEPTGQFVTVAGHLVTVLIEVEKTVDVVMDTPVPPGVDDEIEAEIHVGVVADVDVAMLELFP